MRRRARTPVDVQDLAQETYLRLLRAQNLSEVRDPHSYLLQVASHVSVEWSARQSRREATADFDVDLLIDESQQPELELDARISQHRFEQTLASLSPRMRAALILRLRDEVPLDEIASRLGITLRQVRRLLVRGYARLREAMES